MSELISSATSEAPILKLAGEILQEGHIQETKNSETHAAVDVANTKILDHISNGTLPKHIENRLEGKLQKPEIQQELISEFSPYSDGINLYISTIDELTVYTQNDLQESYSNALERPCLKANIDPERTDAMGRSNVERTAVGLAPVDENGDAFNLHHIGQKHNSPLAELPDRIHKECDALLHDKTIATEVHGEDSNWNAIRAKYWKERSPTL
jgi:hypothetical protein